MFSIHLPRLQHCAIFLAKWHLFILSPLSLQQYMLVIFSIDSYFIDASKTFERLNVWIINDCICNKNLIQRNKCDVKPSSAWNHCMLNLISILVTCHWWTTNMIVWKKNPSDNPCSVSIIMPTLCIIFHKHPSPTSTMKNTIVFTTRLWQIKAKAKYRIHNSNWHKTPHISPYGKPKWHLFPI